MATEVDLDKVKDGDRLVVEVPVVVHETGSIELNHTDVRLFHDEPRIKVLQHLPRLDEPKGLGGESFLILGGPLNRKRWSGGDERFESAEIEWSLRLGWSPTATPELPVIKVGYRRQRVVLADTVFNCYMPEDWDFDDVNHALRAYARDAMRGNLREQEVL